MTSDQQAYDLNLTLIEDGPLVVLSKECGYRPAETELLTRYLAWTDSLVAYLARHSELNEHDVEDASQDAGTTLDTRADASGCISQRQSLPISLSNAAVATRASPHMSWTPCTIPGARMNMALSVAATNAQLPCRDSGTTLANRSESLLKDYVERRLCSRSDWSVFSISCSCVFLHTVMGRLTS